MKNKYSFLNNKETNNPNWKGGKSIINCEYCKINFSDWKCKNRIFCSKKCKDKSLIGKPSWNKGLKCPNISEGKKKYKFTQEHKDNIKANRPSLRGEKHWRYGKKHTKEAIKKIRQARLRQKIPNKHTSIEIKIKKYLDILRIPYKTHKAVMGITQPDFFIEPNICIYCDGDYWHNLPEVKERDKKINRILKFAGYKVIRFWEREIKLMEVNDLNIKLQEVKIW